MSDIARTSRVGKLNTVAYKALEGAAVFAKLRGNPYVEFVHWLHQLLQAGESDVTHIIRQYSLDTSRLASDLTAALDRLPRGATSGTDLSLHLMDATQRAWTYATLRYSQLAIRSGHMLVAILRASELEHLLKFSAEWKQINADELMANLDRICEKSPETSLTPSIAK